MKINSLGQIIATRALELSGQERITIRVGAPLQPLEFNGDYCCPYQISGLGDEHIRYGAGVDSLQAIYMALMRIATDLYTSENNEKGKITWYGSHDLGLPLPESIRDLGPA